MLGNYNDIKIPSYLKDMQRQVNTYLQTITDYANATIKNDNLSVSDIKHSQLVVKGLLLMVKYRSSLPNGTYVLKADLSKLVKLL